MVTARTKILKHIWETGGGYINSCGNVTLITKLALKDTGIYADVSNITIEQTIHKGQNVAILRGLVATRGKGYLYKIITGICIDNRFYIPIDKAYNTTRLPNGSLKDTYMFALVEQYSEDDKPKNNS